MKVKQRIISFLLAFIMIFSSVVPVFAETEEISKEVLKVEDNIDKKNIEDNIKIDSNMKEEVNLKGDTEETPLKTNIKEKVKDESLTEVKIESKEEIQTINKTESSISPQKEIDNSVSSEEKSKNVIEENNVDGLINETEVIKTTTEEFITENDNKIEPVDNTKKFIIDKVESELINEETTKITPLKDIEKKIEEEPVSNGVKITPDMDLTEIKPMSNKLFASSFSALPTLKALSDPMITDLPRELDGTKIESVNIEWITTDNDTDAQTLNLKWIDYNNDPRYVRFKMSFALSGQYDYEPGKISIKIPNKIFKNREGNFTGELTLGVPEAPDTKALFAYTMFDDYVLITNTKNIAAASVGMIEGTFTNLIPNDIKDIATGYITEPLSAELRVTTNKDNIVGANTENLYATVDTKAKIDNLITKGSSVYEEWPTTFPDTLKPDNHEDYIYVKWNSYAYLTANQIFKLDISSNVNTGKDGKNGVLLGYNVSKTGKLKNTNMSPSINENVFEGVVDTEKGGQRDFYIDYYVAYPKTDFEEFRDYNLTNNIEYTLTALDDAEVSKTSATSTIKYQPVEYVYPRGHFIVLKTGLGPSSKVVSGKKEGIYGFGLNQLKSGEDINVRYLVSTEGFGEYLTLKDGLSPNEKSSYNQIPYKLSSRDYHTTFNYKNNTYDDYEFKSVEITNVRGFDYLKFDKEQYGYMEEILESGESVVGYQLIQEGGYGYKPILDDTRLPVINIYGKTANSDYVLYGTAIKEGLSVKTTPLNGAKIIDDELVFPEGIIEYKMESETTLGALIWTAEPTVTIKASENNVEIVNNLYKNSDAPVTKTSNEVDMKVYSSNLEGGETFINKDSARNEIQGFANGVKLTKRLSNIVNDKENRVVNFDYNLRAILQTNISNQKLLKEAIEKGVFKEETSQTWYDLLPKGVIPLLNSVQVNDGIVLSKKILSNYKNSGRDLLIIKTERTPNYSYEGSTGSIIGDAGLKDQIDLSFKVRYSWESLNDFGEDLINNAAYESNNSELGVISGLKGEPDNPLFGNNTDSVSAVEGVEDIMTNLNPLHDNSSFIYAKNNNRLTVDNFALMSLSKRVDVNNEGLFGDGIDEKLSKNVYEGGQYTYRLRMRNSPMSSAKDIIIYDNLENFVPDSSTQDFEDIRWRGTFKNIDVSQLINKGIKPIVYYSTVPGLVLNNTDDTSDNDLSNTDIWSTVKPEESTITAIAIDASKKTDGTDFILKPDESITANIYMKAPVVKDLAKAGEEKLWYDGILKDGELEAGLTGGAHAYNSVSSISTTIDENNTVTENELTENKYTKVGLMPYILNIEKSWNDNNNQDGLRPSSVEIKLLADEKDTGNSVILNQENNFKGSFGQVPYTNEKGEKIDYTIKESTSEYTLRYTKEETPEGEVFKAINNYIPKKIDIKVNKIWEGGTPQDVKVILYKDSQEYSSITLSNLNNWSYIFKGLNKYEDGKLINYEVKEQYLPGYISTINDFNIINKYYPYGNLILSKEVLNGTDKVTNKEFTFTFEFFDKKGDVDLNNYSYTKSDGTKGFISTGQSVNLKDKETIIIENIESDGSYRIKEKSQPGFILDTNKSKNLEGEIKAGETVKSLAVNRYQTKGQALIKANKILENTDLKAYKFIFDLYDDKGNVIKSGSNDSLGNIYISPVNYTNDDVNKTYTYTLKERNNNLSGYIYDDSIKTITVNVLDNGDGTITATPVFKDDDNTFKNSYEAFGELKLKAWKTLIGHKQTENQFNFEVKREDTDEIVSRGTNDINGVIHFSPINFNEKDIGKTIKLIGYEVAGTDETIIYDDSTVTYTVKVNDNGNGTLSFETIAYDNETTIGNDSTTPLFVNRYKNGSLTIEKLINGAYDGNEIFKFLVKFIGDENLLPKGELEIERAEIIPTSVAFRTDYGRTPNNIELKTEEGRHSIIMPETTKKDLDTYWVSGNTVVPGGERISYNVVKDGNVFFDDLSIKQEENTVVFEEVYIDKSILSTMGGLSNQLYGLQVGESLLNQDIQQLNAVPLQAISIPAPSGNIVSSGTQGTVIWEIHDNGVLNFRPSNGTSGIFDYMGDDINTRPWLNQEGKYQYVSFSPGVKATQPIQLMFANSQAIAMDFTNFDTSEVNAMYGLFKDAKNLQSVNLSTLNTSNVTRFDYMFSGTSSLTDLDLSNFDTSRATTMAYMFNEATSLKNLNVSTFDTSNVTSMAGMFFNVKSLTDLNLSNFNTSKVTTMNNMFSKMLLLQNLDISNFDTSLVTNMSSMFLSTESLPDLNLSHFNTANVTDMSFMFMSSGINTLNVSSFDTTKLKDMDYMFAFTSKLVNLDLTSFSTPNLLYMTKTFMYMSALETLLIPNLDTKNITNMSKLFAGNGKLKSLDLSNFNTAKVTSMSEMFDGNFSLVDLNVSNFNTANVTDMSSMFNNNMSLKSLDLTSFDTSQVKNMSNMFNNNYVLSNIKQNFNTINVINMNSMFKNARELSDLDISNWNTQNVTDMGYMFFSVFSQSSLDLSNFDTSKVTDMSNMFALTIGLKDIIIPKTFVTSNVTTMDSMFYYTGLETLDLTTFDTSNVKDMDNMFCKSKNLKEIDISTFDMTNVTTATNFLCAENVAIEKIVIGDGFKIAEGFILPDSQVDGKFTGEWMRDDEVYGPMTPQNFNEQYQPNMSGVWIRELAPIEYTVLFDSNGAAGSMSNISIAENVNFEIPKPTFTYFGKQFMGWNTAIDGTGTTYLPKEIVQNLTTPGSEITLYAQWKDIGGINYLGDNIYEVLIPGNSLAKIDNLSAGLGYEVYEETPEGWVLIDSTGTTGTIKPLENSVASFVNEYSHNKVSVVLKGEKFLDNKLISGYDFELRDSEETILQTATSENGNFTFKPLVFDTEGLYVYTIKEVIKNAPGIIFDTHIERIEIEVVKDKDGNLIATVNSDVDGVKFINNIKKNNLIITKEVIGTVDDTKEFALELILNGDEFNKQKITIKNGETKVISDIPYGTTYELSELNLPVGYKIEEITNSKGVITDQNISILVKNSYNPQGSFNIQVNKELIGRELQADEFEFVLEDINGNPIKTTSGGTYTTKNSSLGDVIFDSIKVTKPGTTQYVIREVAGTDTSVIYDNEPITVTAVTTDNGNGTLSTELTYSKTTFTNKLKGGNLQISKTVENSQPSIVNKNYPIIINLKDAQGNIVPGEYNYSSNLGQSGTISSGDTLLIKDNEIITIIDLPNNTKFEVIEEVPTGFKLKEDSITTGTIVTNEFANAKLINVYDAQGEYTIEATKQLTGANIADYSFDFILLQGEKLIDNVTSDTEGNIKFNPITFGMEDIGKKFTYTILENKGLENSIIYDTTTYDITLTVEDNGDGTLKITSDKVKSDLIFTNKFEDTVSLKIIKKDIRNNSIMSDVGFELFRGTNSIGTYKTNELGEILISDLQKDVYTLREINTKPGYKLLSEDITIDLTDKTGVHEIIVTNEIQELPMTGLESALGIVLLTASLASIPGIKSIRDKRKKIK